jgi:predicted DsbA family dithiol-disulfide isomerase
MTIEVWTDIYYPWCYIGKRRLEAALEGFEHKDAVDVIWRSFQLDPDAPRNFPGSADDMLVQRYGRSLAEARQQHARLAALAADEGLQYRFDLARPGNSFDAHRLLYLANAHGQGGAMEERLMRGYSSEGLDLGDPDHLEKVGAEVGLDPVEVRKMLGSEAYSAEVRADIDRARDIGFGGVPAFLIDGRYAISGAQRSEVLSNALRRAWADES